MPIPATTTPTMNFQEDIRTFVLANMPYDAAKRSELEALHTPDLLIIFQNWRNRLIPQRTRRVHPSAAFSKNPLAATYRTDLDQLIAKITNGDDLTPHLSRRILKGYESSNAGPFGGRPDLDLMLADWQIHHLHLSSVLEQDGFVKRDGPLLFAAFFGEDAYIIDIFGHRDWTKEIVARILIDEWPNCGLVHELRGAIGLERSLSEQDRGLLRSNGINSSLIEHNGKVYMIGRGGITSAGTSVVATRQADYILAALESFAKHVTAYPNYIADTLQANGLTPPETPHLRYVFVPDGSGYIQEQQTGALFPLPQG